MIAVGRLLVSVLLLKTKAEWIWLTLPLLMITSFLLMPLAYTASAGISMFALAGLGCSAFFPLSVDLISKRFPESVPLISSLMIASLMIGVGVGSFIIGPLRGAVSLERLYQYSALYPAGAFILALVTVAYRWRKEGVKIETCRQVLGRTC
jgi:predicted MFS family arabinose efflux permease